MKLFRATNFRRLPLALMLTIYIVSCGAEERAVYWNRTNAFFKEENNPLLVAHLGDVIHFVCPRRDGNSEEAAVNDVFIVYKVGELAFGDCMLETQSMEILRCDDAIEGEPKRATFGVRQLSPVSDGREFYPGERYFYITTSKGTPEGLSSKSRGLCESENMRLELRIADKDSLSSTESENPYALDDPGNFQTRADYEPIDYQVSPRFRTRASSTNGDASHTKPRQFEIIPPSAGVRPDQFEEVKQMAVKGRTGTFHNQKETDQLDEKQFNSVADEMSDPSWSPAEMQQTLDQMRKNSLANVNKMVEKSVEGNHADYIVHEDTPRSSRYSFEVDSARSTCALISFAALLSILMLIL